MNLFGRFAVASGRFSRKISVLRKGKVVKSTSLKKNLLEGTEARSSFGNDKTVTVSSLCYSRNA